MPYIHASHRLPELRRSVSGSRSLQHRRRYNLTACQENKRRRRAPYKSRPGREFSAAVAPVQLVTVRNERDEDTESRRDILIVGKLQNQKYGLNHKKIESLAAFLNESNLSCFASQNFESGCPMTPLRNPFV